MAHNTTRCDNIVANIGRDKEQCDSYDETSQRPLTSELTCMWVNSTAARPGKHPTWGNRSPSQKYAPPFNNLFYIVTLLQPLLYQFDTCLRYVSILFSKEKNSVLLNSEIGYFLSFTKVIDAEQLDIFGTKRKYKT